MKDEALELLDWIEHNVLDSHDWLGTGSCSKSAAREEKEARLKFERLKALINELP